MAKEHDRTTMTFEDDGTYVTATGRIVTPPSAYMKREGVQRNIKAIKAAAFYRELLDRQTQSPS